MKRYVVAVLIFLSSLSIMTDAEALDEKAAARNEFRSSIVYNLWLDYQKNPKALDEFYNSHTDLHLIEPHPTNPKQSRVVYFAKGEQNTDYIMQSGGPDFYGLRFSQIGNSHYYYCVQDIANDAFFNYGFNHFIRKRFNPDRELYVSWMEHIHDGAVIGPEATLSPYVNVNPEAPEGKVLTASIFSDSMSEKREFAIYVPADYDPAIHHNLIIQLDGQNYMRPAEYAQSWKGWTPLPTILDNLHNEEKLSPTIAVFVFNQGKRSEDMLDKRFHSFLAKELVPWIKSRYSISEMSADTIISGPSRAAFASAYTAFQYPEVFGGVLAQSGSFYYTLDEDRNWPIYPEYEGILLTKFKQSQTLPIRWYIDVGLYDLGLAAVGTNRQFKDIIDLKGYPVKYSEYKGGHSHLSWRHRLHLGIINLLGD